MMHLPHSQPLPFYCLIIEAGVMLLTLLALWVPPLLGYDLGDGSIDHTSAYAAWIWLAGAGLTLVAMLVGLVSGLHRLIKPRGYSRPLIAAYTFLPIAAVLLWSAI